METNSRSSSLFVTCPSGFALSAKEAELDFSDGIVLRVSSRGKKISLEYKSENHTVETLVPLGHLIPLRVLSLKTCKSSF